MYATNGYMNKPACNKHRYVYQPRIPNIIEEMLENLSFFQPGPAFQEQGSTLAQRRPDRLRGLKPFVYLGASPGQRRSPDSQHFSVVSCECGFKRALISNAFKIFRPAAYDMGSILLMLMLLLHYRCLFCCYCSC